MIEIAVDDRVIQLKPYMSIEQYQKFTRNQELYKTSPADLLSMWLDLSIFEVKELPLEDVKFIENYITQELTKDFDGDALYEVFEFEGKEYGLENDWSKLSWGAWMDFQVLSVGNVNENIHKIMSILYRPISSKDKKGKYKIKPYKADEIDERAELFKGLPIKYWLGAANFFFLISIIYSDNIKNSLNTMRGSNLIMMRGWNLLPKFLKNKISLNSILRLPSNWQMKT